MPTFCTLAGANNDYSNSLKWDGKNIWKVLVGEQDLIPRQLYSAGVHFRSKALRDGDWKLILFQSKGSNQERAELYNIAKDPSEKEDLAAKEPERLGRMRAAIKSASKNDRDSVAIVDN